jgi:glycosyltransferase involved in cell wall biosynthesis
MISFVVPAHNEAPLIRATCESIVAAARACGIEFELIVVDDASSDGTADVARAAGASVVRTERRHIAAARNTGARHARGDVLIFVDADTTIGPEVLNQVFGALDAGAIGGGAAVRFDEPVPWYARASLPVLCWFFRRLKYAAGCFVYCTQRAFEAVGGFDEQLFAAEEIYFSRALRRAGRVVVVPAAVTTSGRKVRAYSWWEIHRDLMRLAVRGRRALRDKRNLEYWYGPRRDQTK